MVVDTSPLVSIVVITYKSVNTIVETLDSIKNQTYPNIELIVSDDNSPDNTVSVVKAWVKNNSARFSRVEVIENPENTGVSANSNRGFRSCKGVWIKIIAGDDMLLPSCIETFQEYVKTQKKYGLLFSRMMIKNGNTVCEDKNHLSVYFNRLSPLEFKSLLLVRNFLPAPSSYICRETYNKLGGFDEKIPYMEDKPFYVKALVNGVSFGFIGKPTVCYRMSDNSLSNSKQTFNGILNDSRKKASIYFRGEMKKISRLFGFYGYIRDKYLYEPSVCHSLLYLLRFVNPFFYYLLYIRIKIIFFSRIESCIKQ